jgi:hypothetical protein
LLKDSISNLTPIFQPDHQTLEGSLSAVSTSIFATKVSFCNISRDLQDLQSFAPLESSYGKSLDPSHRSDLKISAKKSATFFELFFQLLQKSHFFQHIFIQHDFIENCTDCDEMLSKFHEISQNGVKNVDNS